MKTKIKTSFICLLCSLAFFTDQGLLAQDYNPPFPRTAFFSPAMAYGGAKDYIIAKYDMVDHGLTPGAGGRAFTDSIRKHNPNILIFGTSRQGVWPQSDPPQLFAYHAVFCTLKVAANPGNTKIQMARVNSSYAYPTRHKYAIIGDDDWISYTSIDTAGFNGVPSTGDWGINRVHSIGDSVRFPNRMSGFGMLPNLSSLAPQIDGNPAYQFFIDKRFQIQDFSIFDGVHYDAFRMILYKSDWETASGIDFDYSRVDDLDEHGYDWINARWQEGITHMLAYEHQRFSDLHPGKPSLIQINTGAAENNYAKSICEGMEWEGFMRYATDWQSTLTVNKAWELKMQQRGILNTVLITDYEPESRATYGKDKFTRMRYGLTTALLGGCFYGRTFGDYYYITYYHDEFDTDLGYPTSDPQKMSSGAYARFFTKGAAICNPTGRIITVNASELTGLSGYEGPYYRLKGGQDPAFNNGHLFESVELYGETRVPARSNQGDGILLFKVPTTVVADVTVGNTFNNDTTPGSKEMELAGSWQKVQDSNDVFPDRMRSYSQWNGTPSNGSSINDGIGYAYALKGTGSVKAIFRPTIGLPGYYEISEWHGWRANDGTTTLAATDLPFKLVVNDITKMQGVINQQINVVGWNVIAIANLPAGNQSYIEYNNKTNGYVFADAMRFKFLGENILPDTTPPTVPKNVRIIQ